MKKTNFGVTCAGLVLAIVLGGCSKGNSSAGVEEVSGSLERGGEWRAGQGTAGSSTSSNGSTAPTSGASKTAASSAYEAYVNSYLDLNLAYNQYAAAGGKMTKDQWGRQHYTVAGQKEGRIVPAASPTAATTAPTAVSYTAYVDSYPDLKAAYRTYVSNGGTLSQGDWGKQHYTNAGQKEGRRLTGSVATSVASSSGGSGASEVAMPLVTESSYQCPPGYYTYDYALGCQTLAEHCASTGPGYSYFPERNFCGTESQIAKQKYYSDCNTAMNASIVSGTGRFGTDLSTCRHSIALSGGSSSSSSSSSEESSSSSSSSSSSVTYCTDASVNWPSMVSVGSTINVSWSLSPSGCTVRNNSSVAPSASNFAGSSSGSSASVSSGSTSLTLPCSGGIDTTPHIGNSKNRMRFDFSSLGAALGNGNSYSGYAQMSGSC